MRVSDKGLAFIADHEGVVTRAYRDVAGVWTIGIGHTAAAGAPKPRAGMTITRAEAFAILARDLPRYERRVAAALTAIGQRAFDGAVSFDFNTGAVHRASWVKAYRAGNLTAARLGLMKWVKAGGRTVRGLVRRREAEARLIFD
ncbi:MAG: lysozyme, partial [Bauldia litoralis]